MLVRKVSHQHSIEDDATTPQVSLEGIIGFLIEHLWSSIAGTSTGCRQLLFRLVEVAEAKVNQLYYVAPSNQDILWLEVSVGHSKRVQVLNSIEQLLKI